MDKPQLQAVLNNAGRMLTSTLDLEAVLEQLIVEIKTLLGATGGSVFLLDGTSDKLVFVAVVAPDAQKLVGQRLPPGIGIVGWTLQHRQSVLVDDAQNDPRFYNQIDSLTGLTTHSLLAVPLIFKERAIGVIELINKAEGPFSQQDQEILEALAGSAAIAIENARLYDELERRAEQLSILHELDRAMATSLRVSDIFHSFSLHAARLFPYDWLSISQLEGEEIHLLHTVSEDKQIMRVNPGISRKNSAAGWAISRGQPLLRHHLVNPTGFASDEPLLARGIRSSLALPLRVKGQIFGAWELGSRQIGAFRADDLDTAQSMADQLAIALENARLFEQVRAGREQLRRLAQQVVSAQEEERRRLSHELHDEAGQMLTALKISLDIIQADLATDSKTVRDMISEASELTDMTMDRLRALARNLRPPALETAGLNPTLEGLCREFTRRVPTAVQYTGVDLPVLPDMVNICLYRFLQEALTNIAKHAQASQVWVNLAVSDHSVHLTIQDNGQGFDLQNWLAVESHLKGIGLLGMRERLEALGGSLEVESQSGQGTSLTARLPR